MAKDRAALNREKAAGRLSRLLAQFGTTEAEFERLAAMPYAELIAAVRRSAAGEPSFGFMRPSAPVETGFEDRVTDPAPTEAIAARRLLADRVMQFLLVRHVHGMTDAQFEKYVAIDGLERLRAAAQTGRGVFVVNSHFGPGPLVPVILARLGFGLTCLAPYDFYGALGIGLGEGVSLVKMSKAFDLQIVMAARSALLSGGIVHSTGDGLRGGGKSVRPFLGKPRCFPDSFAFLSIDAGADCVPVFVRCDEFGRIGVEFCAPLDRGGEDAPLQERIDTMTDQYGAALEHRWLTDIGNVPTRSLQMFGEAGPDGD